MGGMIDHVQPGFDHWISFKGQGVYFGDPKQANFLFRNIADTKNQGTDNKNNNNNSHPHDKLELGMIDFQWSGFGLAATDFAHFMTSCKQSIKYSN